MRSRFQNITLSDEDIIAKTQMNLLDCVYMQTNAIVVASLLCACITFINFFSLKQDNLILFCWFACYLAITIIRVILVHIYELHIIKRHHRYWYYVYFSSIIAMGMIWGAPAFLLLPNATMQQQIIFMITLMGITACAIPFLSYLPLMAITFLSFTIVPYIAHYALFVQGQLAIADIVLMMYFLYCLFLVMKFHSFIFNSVKTKIFNEQLQQQNNQLQKQLDSSHKKLVEIETHDGLTHLANWELFKLKLNEAIKHAELTKQFVALLYIDLDYFKNININFSYQIGDYVLLHVAERLKYFFADEEMIARLGSDEFVIILENMVTIDAVHHIANQACQLIAKPYFIASQTIHITASIGISIYPDDSDTNEVLLTIANKRMSKMKQRGGNRTYAPNLLHEEIYS